MMKKYMRFFVFIVGFSCAFSLLAQTQKGNFVVSGKTGISTGYGIHNYTVENMLGGAGGGLELEDTKVELSPEIAYFIIDNLAIRLSAAYRYERTRGYNSPNVRNVATHALTIFPNVQYYFPTGVSVRPYIQSGAGFMRIDANAGLANETKRKQPFSGFVYGAGAGVSYFITNNVSFDLLALYERATLTNLDDKKLKAKANGFKGLFGVSVFF